MEYDQLFIFFAGHGQYDELLGQGYIVSSDSKLHDEAKSSYLSHAVLRGAIDNIPSRHTLLVMDFVLEVHLILPLLDLGPEVLMIHTAKYLRLNLSNEKCDLRPGNISRLEVKPTYQTAVLVCTHLLQANS